MEISGTLDTYPAGSGVFYLASNSTKSKIWGAMDDRGVSTQTHFKASKNWTGATSSNGAHSHSITLTKSSIYGNSETVQPPAVTILTKTRYY